MAIQGWMSEPIVFSDALKRHIDAFTLRYAVEGLPPGEVEASKKRVRSRVKEVIDAIHLAIDIRERFCGAIGGPCLLKNLSAKKYIALDGAEIALITEAAKELFNAKIELIPQKALENEVSYLGGKLFPRRRRFFCRVDIELAGGLPLLKREQKKGADGAYEEDPYTALYSRL